MLIPTHVVCVLHQEQLQTISIIRENHSLHIIMRTVTPHCIRYTRVQVNATLSILFTCSLGATNNLCTWCPIHVHIQARRHT